MLQARISVLGEAAWLATRIVQALAKPYHLSGTELHGSASVGVAAFADAANADPEQLLAKADAALYDAKRRGRNRFCFAVPYGSADSDRFGENRDDVAAIER